ncbi:hypothetical protein BJ912DRAFT_1065135 [Pholiota molesta]|nr:hypothetical protein BJ912DRAFT_1065135 [Pholiota molesta]
MNIRDIVQRQAHRQGDKVSEGPADFSVASAKLEDGNDHVLDAEERGRIVDDFDKASGNDVFRAVEISCHVTPPATHGSLRNSPERFDHAPAPPSHIRDSSVRDHTHDRIIFLIPRRRNSALAAPQYLRSRPHAPAADATTSTCRRRLVRPPHVRAAGFGPHADTPTTSAAHWAPLPAPRCAHPHRTLMFLVGSHAPPPPPSFISTSQCRRRLCLANIDP